MFNYIKTLFGAEQHATLTDIRGRKSSGVEDWSGYDHWRMDENDPDFYERYKKRGHSATD